MNNVDFTLVKIRPLVKADYEPFIMQIHYSRRMPQVQHGFGAYLGDELIGVVTYGIPANFNLNSCGEFPVLELNRLCLKYKIKNLSSFIISGTLKLLPSPTVVISYADSSWGHYGYVYQSTNWIYTGVSLGDKEFKIDGKLYHRKNCFNKFGTGSLERLKLMFPESTFEVFKQGDKHRYFQVVGDKRQKRKMREQISLKYKTLPYPKGDGSYYDTEDPVRPTP